MNTEENNSCSNCGKSYTYGPVIIQPQTIKNITPTTAPAIKK